MTDVANPTRGSRRTAHVHVDDALFGRAERRRVARGSLGRWQPAAGRPDAVDILLAQAAGRVPDLVPIRHGRMARSPFAFHWGAAAVMAGDLASTPRTALRVQLCGDAHLANFGVYASPKRSLVFDLNDVDETLPGPFEWDTRRLAASFVVAGRTLGWPQPLIRQVVRDSLGSYRRRMR